MGTPVITRWRLKQLNTNRLVDINVSENSMVGRNSTAKICLRSNKASRTHAAFVVNGEGNLLVQDLKSINGTYVNGTQIEVYILHRVYAGDTISFGLGHMSIAEDDRDRLCFFEVLPSDAPAPKEEVSLEHSTTDSVELSNRSTRNTTNELNPGLEASCSSRRDPVVIEISSNASSGVDSPLKQLEISNVCSLHEEDPEEAKKPRVTGQITASEVSLALSKSIDSSKNVKEDTHSLRISSRRRTIQRDPNDLKNEENVKESLSKGDAGTSSTKNIDDDLEDLLMHLDDAITGNDHISHDIASTSDEKKQIVEAEAAKPPKKKKNNNTCVTLESETKNQKDKKASESTDKPKTGKNGSAVTRSNSKKEKSGPTVTMKPEQTTQQKNNKVSEKSMPLPHLNGQPSKREVIEESPHKTPKKGDIPSTSSKNKIEKLVPTVTIKPEKTAQKNNTVSDPEPEKTAHQKNDKVSEKSMPRPHLNGQPSKREVIQEPPDKTAKEDDIPPSTSSKNKNENLGLEKYNSRRSIIDFGPSKAESVDNSFTVDQDNSVIIDITDDNDDDEMDFSCSQIFQMSQIIKTEGQDDMYQKIKNELAEMDFCNEEIILNPVPINLEDDFDKSGFENTQDICALLQDEEEGGGKLGPAASLLAYQEVELSVGGSKTADSKTTKTSSSSSATAAVQNDSGVSGKLKPSTSSEKHKTTKPPIIEPHTITKPAKKLRQSPRTKTCVPSNVEKRSANKRKSSMEVPSEKKKVKSSYPKNTIKPIYPIGVPKEIMQELKRRRSVSMDLDKAEKSNIRDERRKKLKDLAGISADIGALPDRPTSAASDEPHSLKTYAIPKLTFKDKDSKEKGRTAKDVLGLKERNNAGGVTASRKGVVENVGYGLKPLDLPPPSANYNLRRAKSSDEIKLRKKNDEANAALNRPITRHSTCVDVSSKPPATASTFDPRCKIIPTARADPRKAHLVPKPNNGPKPSHPKMTYPNHMVLPPEASRRLMWTNGGPARRPAQQHKRLANVDDVTKQMVQWLPNWLLEQVNIDTSPPVNNPPAKKVPLHFRDFSQYYDTFSKLVLLENWQYLFKGFREASEQPRKVKIEHVRIANDLMILDCVCYISRQELRQGHFYRPEDFLLLEYVINDVNNCYLSLNFGMVQSCRKSTISNDTIISIKLGDLCPGDPHTKLEFTVLTRYQPKKEINTKKLPIVKLLANSRGHLMLLRAIKGIEESPLCSMILSPTMTDYKFTTTHRNIIHHHNLNPQQKSIVLEAASLCTGNRHGVFCVKGPPGTGKSTVLVNLIFQILFSHHVAKKPGKAPMILLAAPSNTAVDNLISKLVAIKHGLGPEWKHHVKCVRIGPESSISKDVIGYSLPRLAEKHVPVKNIDLPQIKAARDRNENLTEFSKTFFGDQYNHELKMCENLIIEKSNLICTTLNSCINGRLIDAVNRGLIEFTCCIIDEATQCHEVEALLPTILGIDKLVLVGDPLQLNATIMNRDALRLGFGQSLFTRLANNFRNDPRSPIKMLTDQYRMHPEICSFPNKQFYEGKLRSFANPANKLPEEIRPYLVFNCEKVSYSDDYTNIDEVHLIKKLLSTILGMVNKSHKYTVGIITPYNAQKELICKNITDLTCKNENCKITVNTVDSFQGSENDIIIISCVRDSSNSFLQNENRLNVALTRAKQALYIIGNYTLFKECRPLYDLREDAKRRKVLMDIKQNPITINNFKGLLLRSKSS